MKIAIVSSLGERGLCCSDGYVLVANTTAADPRTLVALDTNCTWLDFLVHQRAQHFESPSYCYVHIIFCLHMSPWVGNWACVLIRPSNTFPVRPALCSKEHRWGSGCRALTTTYIADL